MRCGVSNACMAIRGEQAEARPSQMPKAVAQRAGGASFGNKVFQRVKDEMATITKHLFHYRNVSVKGRSGGANAGVPVLLWPRGEQARCSKKTHCVSVFYPLFRVS